jgi:hypothetical protein
MFSRPGQFGEDAKSTCELMSAMLGELIQGTDSVELNPCSGLPRLGSRAPDALSCAGSFICCNSECSKPKDRLGPLTLQPSYIVVPTLLETSKNRSNVSQR